MSDYSINALGSDPALIAALQTYNPNFQASQTQALRNVGATTESQVPQVQTTSTNSVAATLPQTDYNTEPDSNTGLIVGAGAIASGAALMFYAAKKGNGKGIIQGFKNIFSKEASKDSKKIANKLESIRVRLDKNGKPIYNIAGKTKTTTAPTDVKALLGGDKKLARQLQSIRYGTGETTISAGTFTLKDGGHTNHITFKADKIEKILNEKGEDITAKFVENGKLKSGLTAEETTFTSKIEDYISKIKSCDKDIVRGKDTNLREFTYTTTIGDNSAECYREFLSRSKAVAKAKGFTEEQLRAQAQTLGKDELLKYGNPKVNKLTTLQDFGAESDEVFAYVNRARENGIDVSSIIAKDFIKKGKLPEGYKIQEFILPNGSKPIKIVDGKVEGITIDGQFYGKDTDKCRAYIERNAESIEKMIEKALKDIRKLKDAVIVPV